MAVLFNAIKSLISILQCCSFICILELHNSYLDVQVMFNFDDSFFANTKHIMFNCMGVKNVVFLTLQLKLYTKRMSHRYPSHLLNGLNSHINKEEQQ